MAAIHGLPPLPKSLSGVLNILRNESRSSQNPHHSNPSSRAESRAESWVDSRPESARSHHSHSGIGQGASAFEPYYANGTQLFSSSSHSSPSNHTSSPKTVLIQNQNVYTKQQSSSGMSQRRISPRMSPPVPGAVAGNVPPQTPPLKSRQSSSLDSQLAMLRNEMVC